jgi:FtsH-binding integral membrane protein
MENITFTQQKMLLMMLGIAIVAAVAWYIISLPSNIPIDQGSKNAIDNITHWFSSQLGHRWPFVLMIIISLLIVIFIMSSGCTITVGDNIWWVFGLTTLTLLVLLTWKWRQEYLSQNYQDLGISKTQYYVEFGLIIALLLLNAGLMWVKL